MTERRLGSISFLLFAGLLLCWALINPPFGGPDEDGHMYRTVSVAEGQIVNLRAGPQGYGTANTIVFVPAKLVEAVTRAACTTALEGPPVPCSALNRSWEGTQAIPSGAARYNPVYYLAVGLGTGFTSGTGSLYLARILSLLLSAGLLAAAFTSAVRSGRTLLPLAVLLAVTPMALLLMSSVNPNGLEIAAAVAVWVFARRCAEDGRAAGRAAWLALTLAASAMIVSRSISSLWLLIAVGAVAHGAGWRRTVTALRSRPGRVSIATAIVVAAANAAWTWYSNALSVTTPIGIGVTPQHLGLTRELDRVWQHSDVWWSEIYGVFGYTNVHLPAALYAAAAVTGMLFVVVVRPARRNLATAGALVVAGFSIALLIEAMGFDTLGYWWQGRYLLPLLVGVPLLLAEGGTRTPRRAAVVTVAAAVVTLDTVALWWLARRGSQSTIWGEVNGGWSPPAPSVLLLLGAALSLGGLAAIAARRALTGASVVVIDTRSAEGSPGEASAGSERELTTTS